MRSFYPTRPKAKVRGKPIPTGLVPVVFGFGNYDAGTRTEVASAHELALVAY